MANRQVTLSPRVALRFLLSVCLLSIVASCVVLFFKYGLGSDALKSFVPFFHLGVEHNVPTFFSVLLLLSAALVSFAAGRVAKVDNLLWTVLAFIFLFLSFDEFGEFHERLIVPVRNAFDTSGFLYFAWIIPYFAFVLVLTVFYFRWLLRLPPRTRRLLVFSAALYLTGVFVMEGLGGLYFDNVGRNRDGFYAFLTTIEETCEMLGVIVYIYAVSSHIERDLGGIQFSLGE